VLIQFIDHFAPSLIAHSTIYSQLLELALLNGIICTGMGLSAWLTNRAAGPLSQRRRSLVIVSGLSVAILVLSYLAWRGSQSVVVASLLGVVQAFLVCLPPLLKAQVLQSVKHSADNAIGLSVLGASKRIAALPVAAVVVAMERHGAAPADSEHVLYLVLLAVGFVAAIGTAAWGLRRPVQSEVLVLSGEES
jgi:type IV secretory pathway TrbD component